MRKNLIALFLVVAILIPSLAVAQSPFDEGLDEKVSYPTEQEA